MKKQFILGIMALAALASCTKSEVLNEGTINEKAISFSAYVGKPNQQTKATTINGNNIGTAGIGVMAWRTGDADITSTTFAEKPVFMPNIRLTIDATDVTTDGKNQTVYGATYEPERYWPSTGAKVSFYAYAPYSDGTGSAPTAAADVPYQPENIKFNINRDANLLTINVPIGDKNIKVQKNAETAIDDANPATYNLVNAGTEYDTHTDFMVARKGNGTLVDTDPADNKYSFDGLDNDNPVGINQNLNKDYTGAVKLQMKHAMSKISFEARAIEGTEAQTDPYSNGKVKVVFDHITLNGNFVNKGIYNLFDHNWTIDANDTHESYSLVNNPDPAVTDAFNPIADELYEKDGYAKKDGSDWFMLNKETHDLMLIPNNDDSNDHGKISSVSGMYYVKTYDDNGAEIESYRDAVYFKSDFSSAPIILKEGKAYIFRFNIKLKKIEFEVVVEDWAEGGVYNIVDTNN